MKTYPLSLGMEFWHAAVSMFLRATNRKKNSKDHRYFSMVENRRVQWFVDSAMDELYVLAKSQGRQAKEIAIRRKRLARLLRKLHAMRKTYPSAISCCCVSAPRKRKRVRAFGFVKIRLPQKDEAVTRDTFTFQADKAKLKAAQQRDGHYLLRNNLTSEDPAVLWTRYIQLTQIESVFRSLKSELGIRPIYHQLEHRADDHVSIAFLAYCLQVTLKNRNIFTLRDGPQLRA